MKSRAWSQFRLPPDRNPYIEWSLGPGYPYYRGGTSLGPFVSTILWLRDITAREFARYMEEISGNSEAPQVRVPELYLGEMNALALNSYITAQVTEDFFAFLTKDDFLKGRVSAMVMGPPIPYYALAREVIAQPFKPPSGKPEKGTVVIGVIDDGIAFANERFQALKGGTRVNYAWIQDAPVRSGGSTVPYGREFWKHDHNGIKGIDTLLAESTSNGFLDEEKFYRLTRLIDYSRQGHKAAAWRASHGTHVMDLAGGFDPKDNRHDRPLISVQLPTATTADTSGTRLDPYVLNAIHYILDRADRIAKQRKSGPLPVVINFSYGLIAGSHDGTSHLEEAIDEVIQDRKQAEPSAPLVVSIPAGNSYLTRTHASVDFKLKKKPKVKKVTLDWRVQPDDRAFSFMEIWLPFRKDPGPDRISVRVTPPNGTQSPPLVEANGQGFAWQPNNDVLAWLFYSHVPYPTDRGRFFIAMLPTNYLSPPGELAPAGVWKVTLEDLALCDGDSVEAWIQRSDTPYGYPQRGRQSYFDQLCYHRFTVQGREIVEDSSPDQPDCWIKRASLVNAIATGEEPIVAGGFRGRELLATHYTAGGPITPARGGKPDRQKRKPDALLVSDDSKVHSGVLAAGSRSNSVVAMNGTSVAGPQLARWAADQLAKADPADRAAVKAEAIQQEAGLPGWKPPLPDKPRGGWGRMTKVEGLPVVPLPRYWE